MEPQAHHYSAGDAQDYAVVLERMNRFQEPEARTAIADLRLPTGSRGLDVGCGVGLYALWLAQAVGPHG
jgi:demethylmenaquinone methyltransferase/2-methoxy-6-polyprenyl-1,4-benzoquinol methylase